MERFPHTVVPGFRVVGFSTLLGFRALKAGDGAWSVHKTLFRFWAILFLTLFVQNWLNTVKSMITK